MINHTDPLVSARILEFIICFPIVIGSIAIFVGLLFEQNSEKEVRETTKNRVGYSNRSSDAGDGGYTTWGTDYGFGDSGHSDCHDGGGSCDGGGDGGGGD